MTPIQLAFNGLLGKEIDLSAAEEGLTAFLLVMAAVKLAEKSETWATRDRGGPGAVEEALQTLEKKRHTLSSVHQNRLRRLHHAYSPTRRAVR